ncbi:DUF2950 domain-containing protein [Niveibacterium sp. 24ML]|uniref:DUF2950 domain-containing protein n=1 Tax=Niveibacterium sp. 24ML TaxID=2985512 RepID=UPI00226EB5A0|nr:DUF2950 domain-containing protein [Niveibacterium sp. 24ML]MCX9155765.1 DUF2950 domain-containing protein [Niveibacterium sp. 24ML]
MTHTLHHRIASFARRLALGGGIAGLLALAPALAAPSVFQTPEDAAAALAAGVKAESGKQILAVLGEESREWVFTGDKPTDKKNWGDFLAAYEAQHTVVELEDGKATLIIGANRYPFAMPIVRVAGGWRFDPKLGKEEILNRRIGKNELSTIEVLRQVVLAQGEYLLMKRGANGQAQYATRFDSTPGKQDGLYWPTAAGEPQSPLGPLVAESEAQGYDKQSRKIAFNGYRFRMLAGQGPDAAGGERTYTVDGVTQGGFAAIAFPVGYGVTGVKTFVVNQEGQIYEKDLGPKTVEIASKTTLYNPDKTWKRVDLK